MLACLYVLSCNLLSFLKKFVYIYGIFIYVYMLDYFRNNMFELADRLVGIYKTHDATKSVTINPKLFADMPVPVSSQSSENNHLPAGTNTVTGSSMTGGSGSSAEGSSAASQKMSSFSSAATGASGSQQQMDAAAVSQSTEPHFKQGRRAVLSDTTNQIKV